MDLDYAFIANAADLMPDGRFNVLGADFDTVHMPGFPAVVPLIAVVAKFKNVTVEDIGRTIRLEIPGVAAAELPVELNKDNSTLLAIAHIVTPVFQHEGSYTFAHFS